ncbi:hypothetical protein DAI22_05g232350 [Oryza sativa Japonica Group]|nr:hypothetical protein DAI22_05g232350 [Oryza sativa Japonica Group]
MGSHPSQLLQLVGTFATSHEGIVHAYVLPLQDDVCSFPLLAHDENSTEARKQLVHRKHRCMVASSAPDARTRHDMEYITVAHYGIVDFVAASLALARDATTRERQR